MLKRKFYDFLLQWKETHGKECLLVKGARQVGKTFIIDKFGRDCYSNYLYVNFITSPECRSLFDGNLDANEIVKRLSMTFQDFKLVPGDTLLFLDEIQNCPNARTAFKPLAIDGRMDVIGSGSLLGITFLDDDPRLNRERREASVPVGYERQCVMHSLDFEEFLWALGYRDDAVGLYRESFDKLVPVPNAANEKMLRLFREYVAVGGMPEVVNHFLAGNSFSAAHDEQMKIVNANLDDIAKYASTTDKPKIRACYLSIPAQLARENRKFKYSAVESGGTARKFGSAIDWLRESALVLECHNLEMPEMPLAAFEKPDCFKLYASDVGTLVGMMGFAVKKPIVENTAKGAAKGGIYENAIMSLLVRRGYAPRYYLPRSNVAEIDFLIEKDSGVVPIEVKAGNASTPSFDAVLERPEIAYGYKFTSGNVGRVGKKITLPHYMAMFV